MTNILKVIITVFIIGLVVLVIVFFSIFGIVPAEKLTKALKGDTATSTEEGKTVVISTTTVIERIIEREVPAKGDKPEEKEIEPESEPKEPSEPEPVKFGDKYKYAFRIADGRFSPATITATKMEDVVIGLKSEDRTYTIKIPDYGLSQTISKGQEKIIAFQALNSGEFDIVCEGCNEGFKATLIVK